MSSFRNETNLLRSRCALSPAGVWCQTKSTRHTVNGWNKLLETSLIQLTVSSFIDHYHRERNHQGLENRLIEPPASERGIGPVSCRERLGGVLNFYYREAA